MQRNKVIPRIIKFVEFILTKHMDTEFHINVYPFLMFEIPFVIICVDSLPLRNSVFCHTVDLYVSYYSKNKLQLFAYSRYSELLFKIYKDSVLNFYTYFTNK